MKMLEKGPPLLCVGLGTFMAVTSLSWLSLFAENLLLWDLMAAPGTLGGHITFQIPFWSLLAWWGFAY